MRAVEDSRIKDKKFCQCGCENEMSLFTEGRGQTRKPRRFIHGHNGRGIRGENHQCWKGGRLKIYGYIKIWKPDYRFCDSKGYVMEHRLVWENEFSASLLPWADIHHKDGNKQNNIWYNLKAMTHSTHDKHHRQEYRDNVLSQRICDICGTNKTKFDKNHYRVQWYGRRKGNSFICNRCYQRNWARIKFNRYLGVVRSMSTAI